MKHCCYGLLWAGLLLSGCGTENASNSGTSGTSSTASISSESTSTTTATSTASISAGLTLYSANCSTCHGSNAVGKTGPKISGSSYTSAQISKAIKNGSGSMPAITTLTDSNITNLVAYLQSL